MFIIWGTRLRRRKLGYAAAFCEKCRDIRPHHVKEVRSVPHLYYIPLGRSTLLGHEGRCRGCNKVWGIDAAEFRGYVADRETPLEQLIEATNPDLPERVARFFDLQERAAEGDITPQERQLLVRRAIAEHNEKVAAREAQTHFDAWAGLAILLALPASVAAFWALDKAFADWATMLWSLLAAMTLIWLPAIALTITDVRRFVARKVMPRLVDDLMRLNPTESELSQALEALRDADYSVAKRIRLNRLTAILAERMASDEP